MMCHANACTGAHRFEQVRCRGCRGKFGTCVDQEFTEVTACPRDPTFDRANVDAERDGYFVIGPMEKVAERQYLPLACSELLHAPRDQNYELVERSLARGISIGSSD